MVDSMKKGKVMDVRGFRLLKFDARLIADDHWLEVHTRQGNHPDDEWVELRGGTKGRDGDHFHEGFNKDTTLRFMKKRGVLKSLAQRAENAETHETLDQNSEDWGGGKFQIKFGLNSNKEFRTVWVSELQLIRRDQASDLTLQSHQSS